MNVFLRMCIMFFCVISSVASAEDGRPSNLKLQVPGPNVPQECAGFFSPEGWGGKWKDGMPAVLWVEEIRADCTTSVVYVWGPSPGDSSANYRSKHDRKEGVIKDGKLVVVLANDPSKSIVIDFTITSSQDLDVHYERVTSERKRTADTVFQKGNIF